MYVCVYYILIYLYIYIYIYIYITYLSIYYLYVLIARLAYNMRRNFMNMCKYSTSRMHVKIKVQEGSVILYVEYNKLFIIQH